MIVVCVHMLYCYDLLCEFVFCFKQKTAYEMRISDWSSDVCSSDLYGSRTYRTWNWRSSVSPGGMTIESNLTRYDQMKSPSSHGVIRADSAPISSSNHIPPSLRRAVSNRMIFQMLGGIVWR